MISCLLSGLVILNINYDAVNEIEEIINKKSIKSPSSKEANDLILKGMMFSVDKYSNYFSPEENTEFNKSKSGKFIGIGVKIMQNKSGFPVITDVIKESPADLAKLKQNDIITKIDGEGIEKIDLLSMSKKIQGPEGTFVTLEIKRKDKTLNFKIERKEIVNKSVFHKLEDDILTLRIKIFTENTYMDVLNLFDKVNPNSYSKILIDLRDNPGGLLDSSVKISNLFMKKDLKITELIDKNQNTIQSYISKESERPFLLSKKISILINKNSASASEVLTGALMDNKIATVYGEKSFGKAAVQEMIELHSIKDASIKLTIAKYLTPSGIDITDTGIEPNIAMDPTKEEEILKNMKNN